MRLIHFKIFSLVPGNNLNQVIMLVLKPIEMNSQLWPFKNIHQQATLGSTHPRRRGRWGEGVPSGPSTAQQTARPARYQLREDFDGEMEIPIQPAVYLFSAEQKNSEREGVTAWSLAVGTDGALMCLDNGQSDSRGELGTGPSSDACRGPFDLCSTLPLMLASWDQSSSLSRCPCASSGTRQGQDTGKTLLLAGPQPK